MRLNFFASLLAGIVLILLTAFSGTADAIDPWNVQENAAMPAGDLSGANILGQTFISHYPRLHSIEILAIASDDLEFSSDSRVVLHVRSRPADSFDTTTASLPLSAFAHNHWAKFIFPPLENSRNQSLYFSLDASMAPITRGTISAWASDDDVYPGGALYLNGIATNRDLVFRAFYEPDALFLLESLARTLERFAPTLVLVLLVCLIPGLILLWLGKSKSQSPTSNFQSPVLYPILILFLLALGVNLWQIRDVSVPLWKDSPVHAEFINQILSTGRLPTGQFYHFGFHLLAALLTIISGASIPQVMLVLGQVLLTLTGLTTWLLVRRLTGNSVAALTSAVCVWFLSPTPAYFVTWGRYPLILGGALLPFALFFAIEFTERSRWNTQLFLIALATCLGMAFAHVRLVAFYLVFVALYLIYFSWRERARKNILPTVFRVGVLVGLETLIVLAWIGNAPPQISSQFAVMTAISTSLGTDVATDVLLSHHGTMLMALAVIGVLFAAWRKTRGTIIALAWYAALFALTALPQNWVGGYLSPAFVLLMLFLPLSILVGELIGFLYAKTTAQSNKAVVVWIVTLGMVVSLGARDMIALVNPATIIFSDADQNAMAWISQNTPRDAKFLINSDTWFASSFSPSDGGWWIPYVAGRRTEFLDSPLDSESVWRWMADRGIAWMYLGWRGGILHKSDFLCRPDRYAVRYERDGVAIVQVRPTNEPALPPPSLCARY